MTAIAIGHRAHSEKFGGVEQSFEGKEIFGSAISDHDDCLMIRNVCVAIRMATECFGDCVKKRAATHSVWPCDLKAFDLDFVTRGVLVRNFGDLEFVQIVFLHQPIGEAQRSFCLGLWCVGVIGSLKNQTNFVSDAV